MPTEALVVRSHTLEKMALTNSVIADFRTCLGVEKNRWFQKETPVAVKSADHQTKLGDVHLGQQTFSVGSSQFDEEFRWAIFS